MSRHSAQRVCSQSSRRRGLRSSDPMLDLDGGIGRMGTRRFLDFLTCADIDPIHFAYKLALLFNLRRTYGKDLLAGEKADRTIAA